MVINMVNCYVVMICFIIIDLITNVLATDLTDCGEDCLESGCSVIMEINSDLACHVTFDNSSSHVREMGESLPLKEFRSGNKTIRCGKYFKKGPKKKECVRTVCRYTDKVKVNKKQSGNIVYEQNITKPIKRKKITLPLKVEPGMKLTAYGGAIKGCTSTQITISMNVKSVTAFWSWFHTRAQWRQKKIIFTRGLSESEYKGDFPISNPNHFAFTVEVTSSSCKIYADKVLLKTLKFIPWVQDFVIMNYNRVQLLVEKTEGTP